MNVEFTGYGENMATFVAANGLTETGIPVKISADGTVAECNANEAFCGICQSVREGYAVVQLAGYVKVKTAAKLIPGYVKLAAGANGTVVENTTTGRELLVVASTAKEAGIIL